MAIIKDLSETYYANLRFLCVCNHLKTLSEMEKILNSSLKKSILKRQFIRVSFKKVLKRKGKEMDSCLNEGPYY